MLRHVWMRGLLAVVLSLGLAATVGAQMALDLDPNEGDQGSREMMVKPGDQIKFQLVSTEPIKDLVGIEVELKYDGKQVKFLGFMPGGIMQGATSMPATKKPNGVGIALALMGRKAGADKPATLGEFKFEVAPSFNQETLIALVGGSLGTAAGTKKLRLSGGIKLMGEGAGKPADQPPGPPGQPPAGPGGPPMGPPPAGMMGPPGQPGPPPGQGHQPSPEEMKKMYDDWRKSPEAKDLNGDRKIDEEDFKMFMHQKMGPPPGGPGGPPMGPPPAGPGGPPMGPPPGGPGGPPMGPPHGGPGGPPMGPPHGGPGGPPMGPGDHRMGPGGPPMDMPPPEEVIKTLPKALQPSFNKTMDMGKATHRAHVEAEIKMRKAELATLKETQAYLAKAPKEEQEAILKALWYFEHMGGPDDGPGPHGPGPGPMGPGPGGPPMGPPPGSHGSGPGPGSMGPGPGGPQMGPPEGMDAKDVVQMMIEKTTEEIKHMQRELQEMR